MRPRLPKSNSLAAPDFKSAREGVTSVYVGALMVALPSVQSVTIVSGLFFFIFFQPPLFHQSDGTMRAKTKITERRTNPFGRLPLNVRAHVPELWGARGTSRMGVAPCTADNHWERSSGAVRKINHCSNMVETITHQAGATLNRPPCQVGNTAWNKTNCK
jgi:hypothetical protein